jgi:electron-transferring-flavoprotein dehydrogenase
MKSGMLAADAVFDALAPGGGGEAGAAAAPAAAGLEVARYQADMEASWVWEELRAVRNYHPAFKNGLLGGVAYSGVAGFLTKGAEPWTWHNTAADWQKTKPAAQCAPIAYPKPDGKLSFDLLTNLARSGTNHEHDQPPHLRIKPGMEAVPRDVSHAVFGGPEGRFCPAKVYEYPEEGGGQLVINAQNCVHCKTCDIKTPAGYIKWSVPEAGGGGPSYEVM